MNANVSIHHHKYPVAALPNLKLAVLIVISLVLLVGAVLVIVSSQVQDSLQTDVIPVAVPVPEPPAVSDQPVLSAETPAPPASEIGPSVVAVPVPTLPLP